MTNDVPKRRTNWRSKDWQSRLQYRDGKWILFHEIPFFDPEKVTGTEFCLAFVPNGEVLISPREARLWFESNEFFIPDELLDALPTGNREIESPPLETPPKQIPQTEPRKKRDKPLTKTVRIRNQRNKFSEPRRGKGMTWQAIYDEYRTRYPKTDESASADNLRHSFEREQERTDNTDN